MKLEELIEKAEYKQHPYGTSWQPFDDKSFDELVGNIDRRGLDKDIIRYQGQILEGWHRYLACLATKAKPTFAEFKGTDLEAAELVHASGIRRQSTPAQRYASFDMLCDACPAFKEKYEKLKAKGEQQQKAGTPLDTGSQRVNVVETKAKAAGVSTATAKKVERIKKEKPEAVAEIAAGKTSANKELRKLAEKGKKIANPAKINGQDKSSKKASATPEKREQKEDEPFKPGDIFYVVQPYDISASPEVQLLAYKIEKVREKTLLATNGEKIQIDSALNLEVAKERFLGIINSLLPNLTKDVARLKAAQKKPRIQHCYKKK